MKQQKRRTLGASNHPCTSTSTLAQVLPCQVNSFSGNLDVCPQGKNIVVDNMTSGYDLYSINRTSPTRCFEIPNQRLYVKMVKFAENGTVVIGGSDHGCVYVFNINDSEPMQVLYHERADCIVQTLAVSVSQRMKPLAQTTSRLFHPLRRTL